MPVKKRVLSKMISEKSQYQSKGSKKRNRPLSDAMGVK